MTLLKWVLIIIYAIADSACIYDYVINENEEDKKRKFNRYFDYHNNDILYDIYVNKIYRF